MNNPEFREYEPAILYEELDKELKTMNEKFPDLHLGIAGRKLPVAECIKIFHQTNPRIMQFNLKTIKDMRQLADEIGRTDSHTSIHLPNWPEFSTETGKLEGKEELIKILSQETQENFNLVTMHLYWNDAQAVIDENGEWKQSPLADRIAEELADLLEASFKSGKIFTIENLRYKPYEHKFPERLGSKPEHLRVARQKLVAIVAQRLKIPIKEVLSKTGFTLDVGHVMGNFELVKDYPPEKWLQSLGNDIKFMHIHDMIPMDEDGIKKQKTHQPLGKGVGEWKKFFELKNKYCPEAEMILEMNSVEDAIESLKYINILK